MYRAVSFFFSFFFKYLKISRHKRQRFESNRIEEKRKRDERRKKTVEVVMRAEKERGEKNRIYIYIYI